MKRLTILSGIIGSMILLSACSLFGSGNDTQNTSSTTNNTSASQGQTNGGGENTGSNGGNQSNQNGSSNSDGNGANSSHTSKGRAINKELANELLETAKQGKITDCEFSVGNKLQEVITKWGDPQAGDVSVAIYRTKRCSFYTDYTESTIPEPVAPAPNTNNGENNEKQDENKPGTENGTENATENTDGAQTEGTEKKEEQPQQQDTIEEDTIDDLSKLKIVAIVSSNAKYRNISVESVKQALGKPMKEKGRKLIYQAGEYTLEFPFNKDKVINSVVVAK